MMLEASRIFSQMGKFTQAAKVEKRYSRSI